MIEQAAWWSSAAVLCGTLMACDKDDDRPVPTRESMQEPVTPAEPPANVERRHEPAEQVEKAKAELEGADGQDIEGEVELYGTADGVRIVAEVEDGTPGKHGIHIHEKGDCSNIEGESMGAHFAPDKQQHALPGEGSERHLGDLGNIEINDDGEGRLEITVKGATLQPNDEMSFLGKAVVVHMAEDVGKERQPSGSSGTPIACGAIKAS